MKSESIVINPAFNNGETVYLKSDLDQVPSCVVGILITPQGLLYNVRSANRDSYYYDFEISREKNVML